MEPNRVPLCNMCDNVMICKYTEDYKKEFEKTKNFKHDILQVSLTCKKFKDNRDKVASNERSN